MARKIRIENPGASHHLINRGDRRGPIFMDDSARQHFLETQGGICVSCVCGRKLTMTLKWISKRLQRGA